MNHTIYALVDVQAAEIFYIGRTTRDPKQRLAEHMTDHLGPSPKQKRIARILDDWQGDVAVTVLETGIGTERQAFMREVFWMETFLSTGTALTNASVDFDGDYFLRDGGVQETGEAERPPDDAPVQKPIPPIPRDLLEIMAASADLHTILCEQDYFRAELIPGLRFCFETARSAKRIETIDAIREANRANSRLVNHGTPVTMQEVALWKLFGEAGARIEEIEEYFQRSRVTIHTYLKADEP